MRPIGSDELAKLEATLKILFDGVASTGVQFAIADLCREHNIYLMRDWEMGRLGECIYDVRVKLEEIEREVQKYHGAPPLVIARLTALGHAVERLEGLHCIQKAITRPYLPDTLEVTP